MDFIDSREASKILDCTPSNIRLLCSSKEKREILGATKMGKFWIFKKSNVEEYAIEREEQKKKYEN